jgi:hypothetical protein
MANGVGAKLLMDRVDGSIKNLKNPQQGTCPAHGSLAEGVITLLECKKYDLEQSSDGNPEQKTDNTDLELFGGKLLSIRNCKITGRDIVMIVLFVCVMAVVMKEFITTIPAN